MFSDDPDEDLLVVSEIHDNIIEVSGGAPGYHDVNLVKSAIARPLHTAMGIDVHRGLYRKAAALLDAIANNHGFRDGNKRTAMAVASYFLDINDFDLEITNQEYESFMLHVVKDKPSVEKISKWLKERCTPIPPTAWHLVDAKKMNEEHPLTFHIPSNAEIKALDIGNSVKLIFNVDAPEHDTPGGERMWVTITKVTKNGFTGTLDNDPMVLRGLKYKDVVKFKDYNIASIYDE
jgi:death-on-curing protein